MRVFYLLPCTIKRGAFTRERVFEISRTNSVTFEGSDEPTIFGTTDVDYLVDENKGPLADRPTSGQRIQGFVRARKVREVPNYVLVEVPSSDVIRVSPNDLIPASDGG